MRQRALFIFRGNFQLAWLLVLAALVAIGIAAAAILNYQAMGNILEAAAFSSHLSLRSSGELIWRTILEVTLLAGGISLLVGCLVIAVALVHLESLFHSLTDGLEQLAHGDYSFRLETKGKRWGYSLLSTFNGAAKEFERRHRQLRMIFDRFNAALSATPQQQLDRAKALQQELRRIGCP